MADGNTMKAYVVTTGDYSNYHILRVFSSLEAAESFRRSYDARYPGYSSTNEDIEVYEVLDSDPGMWELHKVSVFLIGPSERHGDIKVSGRDLRSDWRIGPVPTSSRPRTGITQIYVYPDADHWREQGVVGQLSVGLFGGSPDVEAVTKAMQDLEMQVRAEWAVYQERAKEKVELPMWMSVLDDWEDDR